MVVVPALFVCSTLSRAVILKGHWTMCAAGGQTAVDSRGGCPPPPLLNRGAAGTGKGQGRGYSAEPRPLRPVTLACWAPPKTADSTSYPSMPGIGGSRDKGSRFPPPLVDGSIYLIQRSANPPHRHSPLKCPSPRVKVLVSPRCDLAPL